MSGLSGTRVAVVGAGLMGHGIAQAFATAGAQVSVFDPDPSAMAALHRRIGVNIDSLGGDRAALDRVRPADSTSAAAAGARIVVEAAPESLELKRGIFSELAGCTGRETILATNTSVMAIGEIAAAAKGAAERIVGTHWWNPPHLVPLVEVVEAERTAAATVRQTMQILSAAGKQPVHVRRDIPGFVGNRLQHALWREALSLLDAGVCDAETIDLVVRQGFGSRLAAIGPVENADFVGLDLVESIHDYLLPHLDRSTAPAEGLRRRVHEGALGAKSGRGYLDWGEGAAERTRRRLATHLQHAVGHDRSCAAAHAPDQSRTEERDAQQT